MHRIDSAGATIDHLFTDGDPTNGTPCTIVDAAWLNALQENVALTIEAAGTELVKGDHTQLADAILALIVGHAPAPAQATEEAAGIAQIATTEEVEAGTDDTTIITPAKLAAALSALGGSSVAEGYIDGGAMTPAITDGASLAVVEDATNHLTRNVMSFQGSTKDTHAFANFRLPGNWDGGTIKAKVLWRGATGCSAGDTVRFALAGAAVSDGEALDLALGAAVNIDDTVNTGAGNLNISPASAALTLSGSPQAGDWLRFRLSRDYDYGAQPMSEAAEVLGIVLQFGVTGNVSAW